MDGGRLEEGVWISHPKRRHGNASGAVRRRKVCQLASPQGQIPITGMHVSKSKAGARILGAYPLSREANEGNGHRWQHDLWSVHRGERGGLGAYDLGRGSEILDQSG